MITIKTKQEIELMRESGKIAAEILKKVQEGVRPGVTTKELDKLAEELILIANRREAEKQSPAEVLAKEGSSNKEDIVKSAFRGEKSGKNEEPYPAVICASVNGVIVHGLPADHKLKEGDILGLDFGVIYKGYCSDLAVTVPVGEVSDDARRLIWVTRKALKRGLKKVRPGNTVGDIGNTIQRYVESQGYGVVRDLVGHGIGKELHEEPQVPNFGKRRSGPKLREGMVIAIEPMVTMGSWELVYSGDNQGFETKDKSLSAHFEHTVAVTSDGYEILTDL